MSFLSTILEIVFPAHCLSCGMPGVDLCLTCLSDSPPAERQSAKWIFPLFDYRHPSIKKAIWLIKYKGKKRLLDVFGDIMYGKIVEELSELSVMENFREPFLVPIPLSARRYRQRGYNQAELLCQTLIKIDKGNNFKLDSNVLIKSKETEQQARIKDRRDRLKNLSGSYALKNAESIKGRNIILIDDVTTTGATLTEAKKVLKQAGARKVIAFTIAH